MGISIGEVIGVIVLVLIFCPIWLFIIVGKRQVPPQPCAEKDTYKYYLVHNDCVVYAKITYDICRRTIEHRKDFPSATIKQVGNKVSHEEAFKWLKHQRAKR